MTLKIERLEIRMQGISPQVARAAVTGLGHALLTQLAQQHGLLQKKRRITVGKIDAGSLQPARNLRPAELQGQMAHRIIAAVTSSGNTSGTL